MSRKRLLGSIAAALAAGDRCRRLRRRHQDGHRRRSPSTAPTPAAAAPGKTVNIIASVPPTDHGWLGAISKNAKAAAAQHTDVKFELLQAADADSQAQQIEQAIAKKPDALVVLPQDGAALTPVAQKAERAGIPVVNIDRLFTAPDAATATVLGDNYQIGVLAANYIADQLKCKGNVVEIQGLAGISVTTDRSKGFADTLKKKCPDGGIKIVAQQPGDFNPDKGLTVMENILQAQKKIDAVYTHDDDMAQGVVQAIRNANRAGRDVPHRRRRLERRDEADQGGRPLPRDVPLQPEHGRHRREHGPADRPRPGLRRARSAGGPAPGDRAGGRGHQGQRRQVREVRVQLERGSMRPVGCSKHPAGRISGITAGLLRCGRAPHGGTPGRAARSRAPRAMVEHLVRDSRRTAAGRRARRAVSSASTMSFCIKPTSNQASSGRSRTSGARAFSIGEPIGLSVITSTASFAVDPGAFGQQQALGEGEHLHGEADVDRELEHQALAVLADVRRACRARAGSARRARRRPRRRRP